MTDPEREPAASQFPPVDPELAAEAEARQVPRFRRCDLQHPMMHELLRWCIYREALRLGRRRERLDALDR